MKANRSAQIIYLQASFYLKKRNKHAWRGIALMKQLFVEFPMEKELIKWGREVLAEYYTRIKNREV